MIKIYLDRSFDMYIDEESKLKPVVVKNEKLQKLGMTWQERTGRQCIPGILLQVM